MDYERDYWIKPDGTLLECEDSHDRTARKILEAEMGLSAIGFVLITLMKCFTAVVGFESKPGKSFKS